MKPETVSAIHEFTLKARALMLKELDEQLEGIYGFLPDGHFGPAEKYPALNNLAEAKETRKRLEQFIADEGDVGLSAQDSRKKLALEVAFTRINRLVALKMMETRGLIRQSVGKGVDSNGFKRWVVKNDEELEKYESGDIPQNEIGEGPRQEAYRHYLLWLCADLSKDIKVLFDPDNLPSRIFPRPLALNKLIDMLNEESLEEAWRPGAEETLGWVYEAFNAEVEKEIRNALKKKKKFSGSEIVPITQLFTPKWVVKYLVENTLGRLWVEMHPDSDIQKRLNYLVPFKNAHRNWKQVKEIKFLDPSCGSMHFGLVAFDLFAEMYKEELEKAGEPGWSKNPSVASLEEIPSSIIAKNIYGIDLDLRAVQLSALTLFIRARTFNKSCKFSDKNLACANVEAITSGRLDAFISQSKFSHPIQERIIRDMADSLKESHQLGSLLRLEKVLEDLINRERKKVDRENQLHLFFSGDSESQFETTADVNEFFSNVSERILKDLDFFVKQSRFRENDLRHFSAETKKGLRVLRIMVAEYDVVATNPPYLDSKDYNNVQRKYLESNFNKSKKNLYAAFIERCIDHVRDSGFVGMITGQSFMFLKSYEDLRYKLIYSNIIETLAQFDYNLFSARVDTAAFVFKKENYDKKRKKHNGIYFRLDKGKNSEDKRITFEKGLDSLIKGENNNIVYECSQEDFFVLPGYPWVFWAPEYIKKIFKNNSPINEIAPVKEGINTGDNTRFVRFWWEIPVETVGKKAYWCRFAKGNAQIPFYNPTSYIVRNSIREIKTLPGSAIRNRGFFYKQAVGFLSNSPKSFCSWITEKDHIFCSTGGRAVFPESNEIPSLTGLLNTTVVKYLLNVINPTISFKTGDVAATRLPISGLYNINDASKAAIRIGKEIASFNENIYCFIGPPTSVSQVYELYERLQLIEDSIDKEVTLLYGLTEEDRLALKAELEGTTSVPIVGRKEGMAGNDDSEGIDESSWSKSALARAWISYSFGTVLGRYAIGEPEGLGRGNFNEKTVAHICGLIDADSVMVSDKGHHNDISANTLRCLELMRGRETAKSIIREAAGSDGDTEEVLRKFLDRFTGNPDVSFWKNHLSLYRNRPIFWPLQSPKRKFTVWVLQERFTRDTLFKVRSDFVDPKTRGLESQVKELKAEVPQSASQDRRRLEKEISQANDMLDDINEFSKCIDKIIQRGYVPRIDDGVLINAAPLWELLPSWPETKKTWKELEAGKYDWAHQAMDHWPERVKEKCKTNKSYAIAHGLA